MERAPFEYRNIVRDVCNDITKTILNEYGAKKNVYVDKIVEGAVKMKAKEVYDRTQDFNLFSGILNSSKEELLINVRELVGKCMEEKDGQHGPDGISECSASSDACSAS
jgi:hypothetical protein